MELAATIFGLGFIEAVVVSKRPVPITYAVRYGLYNILPSFVCQKLDYRLATNVESNIIAGEFSAAMKNRIIISKQLRCLRYGIAVYGLLAYGWQYIVKEELKEPSGLVRKKAYWNFTGNKTLRFTNDMNKYVGSRMDKHILPVFATKSPWMKEDCIMVDKDKCWDDRWVDEFKHQKRIVIEMELLGDDRDVLTVYKKMYAQLKQRQDELGCEEIVVVALANANFIPELAKWEEIDIVVNVDLVNGQRIAEYAGDRSIQSSSVEIQQMIVPFQYKQDSVRNTLYVCTGTSYADSIAQAEALLQEEERIETDVLAVVPNPTRNTFNSKYRIATLSKDNSFLLDTIRTSLLENQDSVTQVRNTLLQQYGSPYHYLGHHYRSDRHSIL